MPSTTKKKCKKVYAETYSDGLGAYIGIEGGVQLHVRYYKGALEIETTDSNTAVEVEPWSSDIRIIFKKRPANRPLRMAD